MKNNLVGLLVFASLLFLFNQCATQTLVYGNVSGIVAEGDLSQMSSVNADEYAPKLRNLVVTEEYEHKGKPDFKIYSGKLFMIIPLGYQTINLHEFCGLGHAKIRHSAGWPPVMLNLLSLFTLPLIYNERGYTIKCE
ncbi:hypothetical protein EHS15_18810 [Leptospira idonii]|uniref:TIGR04452 family lipoprotein n=2 Tax=Leptospira idonii TaxID=1193500 RepID=A0A4R9LTM1_9LEPT|nr:hypothetical protein EHS15_18810 [Leptospira idonii]